MTLGRRSMHQGVIQGLSVNIAGSEMSGYGICNMLLRWPADYGIVIDHIYKWYIRSRENCQIGRTLVVSESISDIITVYL